MANYYGSLEAVDCHIHSVRYDVVLRVELAAASNAYYAIDVPRRTILVQLVFGKKDKLDDVMGDDE
eukprot:scaffold15005_cov73-Skeletonema_marinoi.AAC.1